MIDWSTALSLMSKADKLVGGLLGVEKAELKLKVAELTTTLASVKTTLTEAKAEAAAKDATIAQLKETNRRTKDELIEYKGRLYRKKADGDEKPAGKPYCSVCLQKDGLLFETSIQQPGRRSVCPSCGSDFGGLPTFMD